MKPLASARRTLRLRLIVPPRVFRGALQALLLAGVYAGAGADSVLTLDVAYPAALARYGALSVASGVVLARDGGKVGVGGMSLDDLEAAPAQLNVAGDAGIAGALSAGSVKVGAAPSPTVEGMLAFNGGAFHVRAGGAWKTLSGACRDFTNPTKAVGGATLSIQTGHAGAGKSWNSAAQWCVENGYVYGELVSYAADAAPHAVFTAAGWKTDSSGRRDLVARCCLPP